MEDLHSWWEVPAVAHFFSLFKSCFSLSDFTIEELEDALLTDGDDEKSTYFVSRLLMELLQGYYDNTHITIATCHEWLRRIMKERWEDEDGRINPLASVEANFHELPLRLKIQIIHRITEYRLDAKDVENKLQGLNATDLRLEPLGCDRDGAKFWYFFGVRLYKESSVEESSQDDKFLSRKKKKRWKKRCNGLGIRLGCNWSVACYSVSDWKKTAHAMKGTDSRRERALVQLITENFLPNLPKIVEDMERQKLSKLQSEPRRASDRLLARKLCEAEQEAERKCALERAERVQKEKEERERTRGDVTTIRMKNDFDKMLRLELERKWKDIASRLQADLQKGVEFSSGDENVTLENDVTTSKLGKRKVADHPEKSGKRQKIIKQSQKKDSKKLKNRSLADGSEKPKKSTTEGWLKKGGKWGKRKKSVEGESDEDELSSEDEEVDEASMRKVLLEVQGHPEAWQFESPVDETIAPGYHSIIKRPMDLSEVDRKLGSGEYETPQDFVLDMTLMFNNCRLYNGPESEYTEVANEIDELFRSLVKKHLSHVPIDDVIYKPVYPESTPHMIPVVSSKESPGESCESDSDAPPVGTTTRAAWRSNISGGRPTTKKTRGRGRGGRGRGAATQQISIRGRPRGRGRGRGRGGRGRRLSKRLSSQRDRISSEKASLDGSEDDQAGLDERTENGEPFDDEPELSPSKSETGKDTSRRSSSSSSRNSSPERSTKKESEETKTKPQNVWSLDFLASQARVLEEQQQQQKPLREEKFESVVENDKSKTKFLEIDGIDSPSQIDDSKDRSPANIESTDDVYDFKDEEERPPSRGRTNRNSVIAGIASPKHAHVTASAPTFPMTPAPMCPMTPGYPDHRFQSPTQPSKRHSIESESPPTPSSGYGSYNQTGRSSTPSEGVPALNPPTPRLESSPEKSVSEKSRNSHWSPLPQPSYVAAPPDKSPVSIDPISQTVSTPPPIKPIHITTSCVSQSESVRSVDTFSKGHKASDKNFHPSVEQTVTNGALQLPNRDKELAALRPNETNSYSPAVTKRLPSQPQPKMVSVVGPSSPQTGTVHHQSLVRPDSQINMPRPFPPSSCPLAPPSETRQNSRSSDKTHVVRQESRTSVTPNSVPSVGHRPMVHTTQSRHSRIQSTTTNNSRTSLHQTTHIPSSRHPNLQEPVKNPRDIPRSSCPDYGGISAAERYTQPNSDRGYDRYVAHPVQNTSQLASKNATPMHSPTMASLGLNWSVGSSMEQRHLPEQRKNVTPGRSSLTPSVTSSQEARSKPRHKQSPSVGPSSSRVASRSNMPQYPTEYMGYPFSAHHPQSPHDFSTQQNGLLSAATNPSLLHSDLTASATLRVLQQQQQHKPTDISSHTSSMFLQAGHYPSAAAQSQADQYRLATAAAAQQHQLNMYHQTSNAQNPWLQLHPSQMDPVYQLMQQHGQYSMYPNLLHKYQ